MKPIHHTFGPHVDRSFLMRTLRASHHPLRYRYGKAHDQFQEALEKQFGHPACLFASGREGLLCLLNALKFPHGSEVIVQGYTCIVLLNAIRAAGLTPVLADIDPDTLNLTKETVEAVRTPKTVMVICQHTFGIPSPLKDLRALCDAHTLYLVEDCAHVLPDTTGPFEMLRYGDFALLSFGRDKAISGIGGGAIMERKREFIHILRNRMQKAPAPSWWSIAALLEYPTRMAMIVRPLIGYGLAGPFLLLHKMLGLFAPVVTKEEKNGRMPGAVHRMPSACAELAIGELHRLQKINDHRRMLTQIYLEEARKRGWSILPGVDQSPTLPLQKFPVFIKRADHIRSVLKKKNVHLDDGWTGCVICPRDTHDAECDTTKVKHASEVCTQILSLPTHPTMTVTQARTLCEILDPLLHS